MEAEKSAHLLSRNLEEKKPFGHQTQLEEFIIVDKDNLNSDLKVSQEAAHGFIFAKNEATFESYALKAAILMQFRFDGTLGFPGGFLELGETVEACLNREMCEEMCIDIKRHYFKPENHIVSHYNKRSGLLTHFYALEITINELETIEVNALAASDYGNEVLGIIRVPLHTLADGYRGFPAFLNNQFVGNARAQLLIALEKLKLIDDIEIKKAVAALPKNI